MPSLTVSVYQNLLKCRRLRNWKQNMRLNMNERKWHQPWFQLCLVTKSHGRWELGLLTLSAVAQLQKMMPRTMFWSIQTLCEQQIYWTFPLFRAWILSFSFSRLLNLWIDRELHHSGFECTNSMLCCMNFCITDAKYVMFSVDWHKSLKGSAIPVIEQSSITEQRMYSRVLTNGML